jgi:DNA-binding NtrC family response regulator
LRRIQPQIKVILTTAYSEEKVLNDLRGEHSWAFIRKPYQFGDLMHLLQHILLEESSASSSETRQAYG